MVTLKARLRHCIVIGDMTLGDAILDRLIHNAHRIDMKDESMRKKQATKLNNVEDKS